MAYLVLRGVRLTEHRLQKHIFVCGNQALYINGNDRRFHHSCIPYRRKSGGGVSNRTERGPRYSVYTYLRESHAPSLTQNIYVSWFYSSKHSFHSTPSNYKDESDSKKEASNNGSKTDSVVQKGTGIKAASDISKPVKLTWRQKLSDINTRAANEGYLRFVMSKIGGFLRHLWDGCKLFWTDLRISAPLLWKYISSGRSAMKRREYRQLTRTIADLIRMVPLIATVAIPFAEIAMPFLVAKGLMPKAFISKEQQDFSDRFYSFQKSSAADTSKSVPIREWVKNHQLVKDFLNIQSRTKRADRDRKMLQKKLEYGALLSESLKHMSRVKTDGTEGASTIQDFTAFMEKVKSAEVMPTNEEIIKFSRLFEDAVTLDDLRIDQLQGLCKILGIDFLGQIPNDRILRFQIEVKLRELMVDDKYIQKEGLDSLAIWELQQACRARGMRAIGVSEERLRFQLEQWLELHLKEQVPSSLLLMSRLMYLDENLSPAEALKQTISVLPETTVDKVKVQSAQSLGEEVDKQTKIKVLSEERKVLKMQEAQEKKEIEAEEAKKVEEEEAKKVEEEAKKVEEEAVKDPAEVAAEPVDKMKEEVLVDTAETLKDTAEQIIDKVAEAPEAEEKVIEEEALEPDITSQDLGVIEKAIEDMSRHEKDEIEDVVEDFKESAERSILLQEQKVEGKGAQKLQTKLGRYLDDLSSTIDELNKERSMLQEKLEINQVQLKHKDEDKQTEQEELKEAISAKKRNLISINEVLLSLRRLQKVPDDVRMQKVLEVLDDDRDGMIDISDVLKVTEELIRENLKLNKTQVGTMMSLLRKEQELEEERKLQEKEEFKDIPEDTLKDIAEDLTEKDKPSDPKNL